MTDRRDQQDGERLAVAVVVPSHKRPADLRGCLDSLVHQQRDPDQVVVVLRRDDRASREVADAYRDRLPLRVVEPGGPGFVPALRAGLTAAEGDVVACTDDDARPRPDWLARLESAFRADGDLVAVGGRDVRPTAPTTYPRGGAVGSLSWWGRLVGRHEEGWEGARDVVHLRGANMAFRAPWPLPDPALQGDGTANEVDLCLAAATHGGRVRFDPETTVEHLVRPRPGAAPGTGLAREGADLTGARARGFNVALVLGKHTRSRSQRWARLAFLLAVGQHTSPGVGRVLLRGWPGAPRARVAASLGAAKLAGWRAGRRGSLRPPPGAAATDPPGRRRRRPAWPRRRQRG